MFKFLKEKLQGLFKEKAEEKRKKECLSEESNDKKIKKEKKRTKEAEKTIQKKEKKEKIIEPTTEKGSEKDKEESLESGIKKENKEEEFIEKKEEKKGFFSKLTERIGLTKIDEEKFENIFEPIEFILLENNVALEVVDKIREEMKQKLINLEVKKDSIDEEVKKSLKQAIRDVLIDPFDLILKINEKRGVFVILFFGINGSGKTTTIAKIANFLKNNNISCVISASDTFRAASIEQISKHGERLGIKVIHHNYGADPSAVAYDAIEYAKAHEIKVVLIDTAGRMYTKTDLMREMEKIVRVTKPDLKIFVAESITGNDATEQAKTFNEAIGIDGTILTKADVDEKGGTSISIGYVTKK
ncbi:MAG: signal recognition particle-docking protein FtsY, partial [Candidatus Pacearchaeota archaeon]